MRWRSSRDRCFLRRERPCWWLYWPASERSQGRACRSAASSRGRSRHHLPPPAPVSVLRNIERKIGGLFEGVFNRTFRSSVQPVELARKLAKEMDEHKTISIHRVYVPDEYTIYLNPADREQFAAYETQMRTELAEYLVEHARREGYSLSARPLVLLETEDDLTVGTFGIAVSTQSPAVRAEAARAPEPAQPEPPARDPQPPVAPPVAPPVPDLPPAVAATPPLA